MAVALTTAQGRVLEALLDGPEYGDRLPRIAHKSSVAGDVGPWATLRSLARRGLVEQLADGRWQLTHAGREALEQ